MEKINHEMSKDCFSLINRMLNKQISVEEYYIELLKLNEKYPMTGHDPLLNQEVMKNYREKEIQPLNFKESAEMFMRYRQIGKRGK